MKIPSRQKSAVAEVWADVPVSSVLTLKQLEIGQCGVIQALRVTDERLLRKMMAFGILPGVTIRLLRRFPAYIFEVGYSQFAVDEGIAAAVEVCPFRGISSGETISVS